MKRTRILAVAAGAAAVAAGLSPFSGTAGADTRERAGANVSTSVSEASAEAAASYWTPARMKAAKPADMAHPAGQPSEGSAPEAAPGTAASVAPAGAKGGAAQAAPEHGTTTVPRPYTDYPDRLNGKVFFRKVSDGKNYVCSGVVVNSTSKRLVHTAGHCVSDGKGRFHTNWAFVPAYSSSSNGHRPYGTWTARELTTRTEWHSFGNFKQDVGIAVMNDLSGVRIVNRLGGQGVSWNQSRNQTWRSMGYPAASPYTGFTQHQCVSGRIADDNPSSRSGPLTIKIHCDMTGGTSGGGWLIRVASNGLGYVNSVNSYRYSSTPDHLYGPYFGNEAKSLYDFANSKG